MTLSKQYGKYIVTLTKHSLKRILERNIPGNRIIHTILTAAEQNHLDSSSELMIENRTENFSLIVAIENTEIKIITALNKINCHRQAGTELIAV